MTSPKRKRHYWSEAETEALRKSVEKYGGHKWATIIKNEPIFTRNGRSQVDLKDRWRNLQRKDEPKHSPTKRRSRSPKKRSIKKRSKSKSPSNEFVIYTISTCGFCADVRDILTAQGKKFKEVKVTNSNKDAVYKKTDPLTNKYRYFPMIIRNGKFIGGYAELKKLF